MRGVEVGGTVGAGTLGLPKLGGRRGAAEGILGGLF